MIRWKRYPHFYDTLPTNVNCWLTERNSLTQRLRKISNGHFELVVLNSRWRIPLADERQLLRLPARKTALVREVLMKGRDQPWIYARSIIPRASCVGPLSELKQGENQPLGDLLFNTPGVSRQLWQWANFSLAQFKTHYPDEKFTDNNSLQQNSALWARRSLFYIAQHPLLVTEMFLPDLLAYTD